MGRPGAECGVHTPLSAESRTVTKTPHPGLALLLVALLAMLAVPAEASVNAFWKELGGSATGGGVSQLSPPRGTGNGVDVTAGADGRPIVIYTDSTIGEDGRILAKRWTGTAWQMISPAAGINDPAIGGEEPQLVISPAGTFFAAWSTRELGGAQVHLRRRVGTSTVWEQLDNSDAPGGLTSLNGSNIFRFSLAVGDDELPVVAFEAPAQKPGIVSPVPGNVTGQHQIYVKKYMGPAQGWQYLGPDPSGSGNTSAGGASEAVSFLVNGGGGYAQHSANTPSLVIDSAGRPNVAFVYTTSYPFGSAPEFVQGNGEIFVTRFDNGVWGPVGPAVPTGDSVAGRGGPGGLSNDPGASGAGSLALSPTGVMWVTWHEASTTSGDSAIFVRRWNGTDTWEEVGGASASGGGISGLQRNFAPRIGIDASELPIVAWQNVFSAAVVFVARFDGADWVEMGPDSASGDGVTGADASPMSLGVSSGTPQHCERRVARVRRRHLLPAGAPAPVLQRAELPVQRRHCAERKRPPRQRTHRHRLPR